MAQIIEETVVLKFSMMVPDSQAKNADNGIVSAETITTLETVAQELVGSIGSIIVEAVKA